MKLRTLALLGAVGWAYSKLPRDPHEWPAYAGEQVAVLREQVEEAIEAGKRASDRRIAQLDREVEEASTSGTTKGP
jgi:hypothetical protein